MPSRKAGGRKPSRKVAHIGFARLAGKVAREYESEGYGVKKARTIGQKVAGKIANMKRKKAR